MIIALRFCSREAERWHRAKDLWHNFVVVRRSMLSCRIAPDLGRASSSDIIDHLGLRHHRAHPRLGPAIESKSWCANDTLSRSRNAYAYRPSRLAVNCTAGTCNLSRISRCARHTRRGCATRELEAFPLLGPRPSCLESGSVMS